MIRGPLLRASQSTWLRRRLVRLTAQELQIAQLAAEGLSNLEIGEGLFLSPRTIGGHLYRMFPKLDITARAQLRDALKRVGCAKCCRNVSQDLGAGTWSGLR